MTKELEALEILNGTARSGDCYGNIDKQAYLILKEALKPNEPMKPNYGGKFPQCPVCRKLLHSIWQKHCDNCTQAIDWSDEK